MDAGAIGLSHGVFEGAVELLPLLEVLGGEHIVDKVLKLVYLGHDLALLLIDRIGITGDGLQIGSEQGVELLKGGADLAHVLKDGLHVAGLDEDLLGLGEIPALHCGLCLDSHLGIVELLLPLLQDIDALVDGIDGNLGLEAEDALDVDLGADFVADLI